MRDARAWETTQVPTDSSNTPIRVDGNVICLADSTQHSVSLYHVARILR